MTKLRKTPLTEGQKDCLRLVDRLLTSKEIARELRISPFTVDQRLDAARRKLGAETRKEAARIFASKDARQISQRFVYETPPVAVSADRAIMAVSNKHRSSNGSNEGGFRAGAFAGKSQKEAGHWILFKGLSDDGDILRLTMPMVGGEGHNLSNFGVIRAIVKTALFSIISMTALVACMSGLMRLM